MEVKLSNITMQFPGTLALDDVTVSFEFDKVHGLVGENGAGKSTFMNVLAGTLSPTQGSIEIDGKPVKFNSSKDALKEGIALVSQEGSLVPDLTAAQNILLGDEPNKIGVINRRELAKRAQDLLSEWFPEVSINLNVPVRDLSMAEQKVIEIIRALRSKVNLIILDEPTATLQSREKAQLWKIIRKLPDQGVGVVLISHFLSEICALSDRVTVLRNGQYVDTIDQKNLSEPLLVRLMLERDEDDFISAKRNAKGQNGANVLSIKDFAYGNIEVDDFHINRGEIVGLIGLTGAGHFRFARAIYSGEKGRSGTVLIDGQKLKKNSITAAQKQGMAFIPDHRMVNSLIGDMSITKNLAMVHPRFAAQKFMGLIKSAKEQNEVDRVSQILQIKAPNSREKINNLSGGNKQKVSIGKWLYGAGERYKIVIFVEPTEGVDVGAKREIYEQIFALADRGVAVLIASSDLLEIEMVTDRAVAFVQGRPFRNIDKNDYSEKTFISAMAGEQK